MTNDTRYDGGRTRCSRLTSTLLKGYFLGKRVCSLTLNFKIKSPTTLTIKLMILESAIQLTTALKRYLISKIC